MARDLTQELRRMDLQREEVQAIWHLANIFQECAVAIPLQGKWLILTIDHGHITGREWRRLQHAQT